MNDDKKEKKNNEAKNLIGSCGLYCGLCNKYQSRAPSRCIGCRIGEQHSWCSIWNCSVKKHGFESCADCNEIFKCDIFQRRKVAEWVPAAENLHKIKTIGLEAWLKEQKKRQSLLEELLRDFNEGRSMNFYCKVCAGMPTDSIKKSITETKEKIAMEKIDKSDIKSKAKVLKTIVKDLAFEANISLD